MKGQKRYVAKRNKNGRVVNIYTSVRECAMFNFCHPDTIAERIKYKRVIDGHTFHYCEVKIL